MVLNIKSTVLWDVRLCSMVKSSQKVLLLQRNMVPPSSGQKNMQYGWTLRCMCSQPDGCTHPKAVGSCRLWVILSGVEKLKLRTCSGELLSHSLSAVTVPTDSLPRN
jgi:hypothetical protein